MPFKNKKTGRTISNEMRDQLTSFKNLAEHRLPEKIEDELQNIVDDSFDKERYQGKVTAGKWAGLEDGTKIRKEKRKKRGGILVDSGKMRGQTRVIRRGSVIRVRSTRTVGKSGEYNLAEIHNEGLGKQKQRQFMPEPGESVPRLDKIIDDFMDEQMDKIFR